MQLCKTISDVLKYFSNLEILKDYNLEKVNIGLQKLGNPDKNYKIIHVAGTNGKGSVCNMTFSVLKNSGKKVGIFTSPHLIHLRERIKTETGEISDEDFINCTNEIIKLGINFSYFEKCFLVASLHFKKVGCEFVILEVGVGGRLDSTNICSPIITAITNISFDHKELLGKTLEEIAREKAGIIKENIPIILSRKNFEIEKIAKEKNTKIIWSENKKTNLIGDFQDENAGIAFEICKYLKIPEKEILEGLQKVTHKGRMDFLLPNLLIDGAHNEDGLKTLKKYLSKIQNNFEKIHLCFALKKGKNPEELIFKIFGESENYILVDLENVMVSAEDLKNSLKKVNYELKKVSEIKNLAKENPNELFLVFGSLYMIGEFYK